MASKFDFLKKRPAPAISPAVSHKSDTPRRGRPPGKRSDPDVVQVTAYIRKRTHLEAKRALLEEERDFSDLVEELLQEWLRKHR